MTPAGEGEQAAVRAADHQQAFLVVDDERGRRDDDAVRARPHRAPVTATEPRSVTNVVTNGKKNGPRTMSESRFP